jgi:hypothetical protein
MNSRHPMLRLLAAVALVALSAAAAAQTLRDAKVEPSSAQPGQAVKLTANFDSAENPNCGIRVHWGDGQTQDFKINQAKDVPLVAPHTYAKAGSYTVMVEPKSQGITIKCVGQNQRAAVNVVAPAPVAASGPAAAARKGGPSCPGGWKLDARSVNRKSGAYTCTAKAGSAAPSPAPECPGALTYFHNAKRGQLGCRP